MQPHRCGSLGHASLALLFGRFRRCRRQLPAPSHWPAAELCNVQRLAAWGCLSGSKFVLVQAAIRRTKCSERDIMHRNCDCAVQTARAFESPARAMTRTSRSSVIDRTFTAHTLNFKSSAQANNTRGSGFAPARRPAAYACRRKTGTGDTLHGERKEPSPRTAPPLPRPCCSRVRDGFRSSGAKSSRAHCYKWRHRIRPSPRLSNFEHSVRNVLSSSSSAPSFCKAFPSRAQTRSPLPSLS